MAVGSNPGAVCPQTPIVNGERESRKKEVRILMALLYVDVSGRKTYRPVVLRYVRRTLFRTKRSARLGRPRVGPTIGLTAMLMTRPGRSQYTEIEAAEELGVSVEHLRKIIRSHVVDQEEDANNIPVHTFQPSDLLILRLLAGMPTTPTQQD
jgi:hypothetical protein